YSLPQANHGLRGVVDVGAVDSPDGVIATIGGDQDGGAVGLCRPDRFITRLQRPRPPFGTVTLGEKHHAPVICVPVVIIVVVKQRTGRKHQRLRLDTAGDGLCESSVFTHHVKLVQIGQRGNGLVQGGHDVVNHVVNR